MSTSYHLTFYIATNLKYTLLSSFAGAFTERRVDYIFGMVSTIQSIVSYLPGSYLKVKVLKKNNFSCFVVCEGEGWFLIHPKARTYIQGV
jgi:hypothetical protein